MKPRRHVARLDAPGKTWCGKRTDDERVLMIVGPFNWEEPIICCNCYNRCNDMHVREARENLPEASSLRI